MGPAAKWRPHAGQRLGQQTDRWNGGVVTERCRKGGEGGNPGDLGKNHKTEARTGPPEERGILNQSAGAVQNSAPFNTKTHRKSAAESCHLTASLVARRCSSRKANILEANHTKTKNVRWAAVRLPLLNTQVESRWATLKTRSTVKKQHKQRSRGHCVHRPHCWSAINSKQK